MNYYEFEAGENSYKLRLNTAAVVQLEKMLGCNPLGIFSDEKLPTVTDMCAVLHCAMQELNHGVSMTKCYAIVDEWQADGHAITDFISVIVEIYKASGLIVSGELKN